MAKRKGRVTSVVAPKGKALAITAEPEAGALTVPASGVPMVNPESLIAQAIANKLPVETLERLLVMRRELKAEWAKEQYFTALAAFQLECPVIERTRIVFNKNFGPGDEEKRGAIRYKYAAIEDIVAKAGPILEKHGFSWTAKPDQPGDAWVAVNLEAHHRDGHHEVTTVRMPSNDPAPGMNKSQATGSAISYATRMAFKGAFGIQTAGEDDDGGASGAPQNEPDPEPPRKAEPRNVTAKPVDPPKGTTTTDTAQPKGKQERKLPDDPVLKGMKMVGVEAYWLLVDGHKSKILSKTYCESQAQRLRLNAGNETFLKDVKETIEKDILAANTAQKEKKA